MPRLALVLLLAFTGCNCHPNVTCDPNACPFGCAPNGDCLSPNTGGGSGGSGGAGGATGGGTGGAGGAGGGAAGSCANGGLCFVRCDGDAGVRGVPPAVPGLSPGWSAALGDCDGDGRLDLAVADTVNSPSLFVAMGGPGGFPTEPSRLTGYGSEALFADVTSDGLADFIDVDDRRITVHVSQGDGGFFGPTIDSDAGVGASDAVLLKVDSDGYLDLAIATAGGGTLLVMQGLDGGGFVERANLPAGRYPWQLSHADVDGDGKDDLAIADGFNDGGVHIFLSNGDFTFRAPQRIAMTESPGDVLAADLDKDTHAEIYVATVNGLFAWATPTATPQWFPGDFLQLTACDTDGDGRRELIAYEFQGLSTFDNTGGQLVRRRVLAVGVSFVPDWLLCADLDRDGREDLLAPLGDSVALFWGGPGGLQSPPAPRTGPRAAWLTAADLDGDGRPDLAAAMEFADSVYIWFNAGGGQLLPPLVLPSGSRPRHVVPADLDRDGKLDLLVANGQNPGAVTGLKNLGGRAFSAPMSTAAGFTTQQVATLDADGDGKPDAVAACLGGGSVQLLRGNGDGSFGAARELVGMTGVPKPASVFGGDVDGDGRDDIVYGHFNASGLTVMHGEGDGGFTYRGVVGQGFNPFSIASADFDHDGRRDLAASNGTLSSGSVSVLFSARDGGFRPELQLGSLGSAWMLQAIDVDGDSWADLVVAHQDSLVGVHLNERDGGFSLERGVFAGDGPKYAVAADFDGDGRLELVSSTRLWPDAGSLTLVDGTCWGW